MKSTVYGTVNKKVFKLGYNENLTFSGCSVRLNEGRELNVHDESNDLGKIFSQIIFMEHTELYQTDKFKKLLLVGDLVVYGEKEFQIIKTAYEENGDVRYYTNFEETYEDRESSIIADENLAKRQSYLRGVQDGKIMEYKRKLGQVVACDNVVNYGRATVTPEGNGFKVLSVDNDNPYKLKKIKWYNFWKN